MVWSFFSQNSDILSMNGRCVAFYYVVLSSISLLNEEIAAITEAKNDAVTSGSN